MEFARARNPLNGRVCGIKQEKRTNKKKRLAAAAAVTDGEDADGEQKSKRKETNVKSKRMDIATMIFLTQSSARHQARLDAMITTLGSLRMECLPPNNHNNTIEQDVLFVNTISRVELVKLRDALAAKLADSAPLCVSILADACLRRMHTTPGAWLPLACVSDCVCAATLPNLVSELMRVFLSSAASFDRRPVEHILRKVLPRGSAARNFNDVFADYTEVSPDMKNMIHRMLICSLVGNYRHSTGHMSMDARVKLYRWFDAEPLATADSDEKEAKRQQKTRTFMQTSMIHMCPRLFIFVIRDYIIHLLEDNAVLRKHFDAAYDYAAFKTITSAAVTWARQYFETNTRNQGTLCRRELFAPNPKFKREMATKFERFHGQMLRTQVKAPPVPFFDFLGSLRGQAPVDLVRIRNQIATGLEKAPMAVPLHDADADADDAMVDDDEVDEKKEKKAEARAEAGEEDEDPDVDQFTLYEKFDDIRALTALVGKMAVAPAVAPEAKRRDPVKLTKQGLPYESSRAMHEYVGRFSRTSTADQVFEAVLQVLVYFGADPAGVVELRGMWEKYKAGGIASTAWRLEMYRFAKRMPFTWALVVAAWTSRLAHTSVRLFDLDYDTYRNQVDAVCRRLDCTPDQIPETACRMCVCTACQSPKSWVNDPLRASTKAKYSFGLKDVMVDLYTDKVTCRSAKAFMHLHCGGQELGVVPLLGSVLEYRGKLYMICPQKNGGHMMIFNPAHSTFTERGPACHECTLEIARERHALLRKNHEYGPAHVHKCFVCEKKIAKPANAFVYAKTTIVCQKHNKPELRAFLLRTLDAHIIETRHTDLKSEQAIRTAILALRSQTKDNWADFNTKRNNMLLKQLRKNTWAKSRN